MEKLSDKTDRKFIDIAECRDYEILTDSGWVDAMKVMQTVPYREYIVTLSDGKSIIVADTHIFFTSDLKEIYAKDCLGAELYTADGPASVTSVTVTDNYSHMYDVEVDGPDHRYYTNGILSHNSITSVAWLCHYICFNEHKKVAILANKGAIAREMLSRLTQMIEHLPFFLQPGCRVLNKGNIVFSNGSEIIAVATSSSSVRGLSLDCVFCDEFGFVNKAEVFYTSTFPVISSGTESKFIISSTPNGVGNMFYKLWEGAVQGANEYKPFRIRWQDVPGRDEKWKAQTISNTSERQFRQEHECAFLGSSATLIEADTLLGLQARPPIKMWRDISYFVEPAEGHQYIMTVDVSKGRGQDYSTCSVFDVTEKTFVLVATYRSNVISPLLFPEYIVRLAKTYNNALVIIENNDSGDVVCNAVYYDYEYENTFVSSSVKSGGIGVRMTKRVKRIGCSNLKDLIESGRLEVYDANLIQELSSFEPHGDSFAASGNNHDDLVMNAVMFSWFVSSDLFASYSNHSLTDLLYSEHVKEMEEDVVPFGFLSSHDSIDTPGMAAHQRIVDDLREWNAL